MKKVILVLIAVSFLACGDENRKQWTQMLGQDKLESWETVENPDNFDLNNGVLTCKEESGLILYKGETEKPYKNFAFEAEIKTTKGAKAGIIFHAPSEGNNIPESGYEVDINNTYNGMDAYPDINMTGSLNRIRNMIYPFADNGEWFTLKVRVRENKIQVLIDTTKMVDYIQPDNPWRPDELSARTVSEGYLGIHTKDGNSSLQMKNLKVKALPDTNKFEPQVSKDWDTKITKLHAQKYPAVDLHTHLKDVLTMEEALQRSRKYGLNYGIAANCGLKFPITDNEGLYEYIQEKDNYPVFTAMQAEGREWVNMFSPDTIAMADYVFTDAMTWTNDNGKRMRLWMPEETYIKTPENFMSQLTEEIVGVANEPIDIYVNPTFLPEEIRSQYNELWTDDRINTIVRALKKNNVALEINNRYELPSKKILKKAKEAGVKFTIGTNNVTRDIGKPEYAVRMINELNLEPTDMWLPPK